MVPFFYTIEVVDTRLTWVTVAGQEILSRDGVVLKISLMASYRIVDPETALHNVQDYQRALYSDLQSAWMQFALFKDLFANNKPTIFFFQ